MQHGDLVFSQGQRQGFGVRGQRLGSNPERGTGQVTDPDFLERHVEGDRKPLVHAISFEHAQHGVFAAQKVADAALGDLDALGLAGGARGVNYIRGVRRQQTLPANPLRRRYQQGFCRPDAGPDVHQARCEFFATDHAHRAGIFQAHGNALDRRIRVKRQPCGTGLGNPGLHHQQTDTAWQPQTHDVTRAHAGLNQAGSYLVGLCIQVLVREVTIRKHQRNLVRNTVGRRFKNICKHLSANQFRLYGSGQDIRMAGTASVRDVQQAQAGQKIGQGK